jgi:cytochrome P450
MAPAPVTAPAAGGRPTERLDFEDPEFVSDPWPLYDWHRRNAPVVWAESLKAYFVFGYEHVREALTSPDFTAFHPFRRSRPAFGASALDTEGAEHTRLRNALAGPFRPRAVNGYATQVVATVVEQLLDELLPLGGGELAGALAWQLPTQVICRIMGLPAADAELVYRLMRPLILYVDHAPMRLSEVVAHRDQLRDYLRANGRSQDSSLMALLADEGGLDELEILNNSILLLAAATETTGASVVNLLARIGSEPGLFAALKRDPSSVPSAVAETLRHEPPLHVTLRYAARDLCIEGVEIPEGAPVQVCLASANRDPAAFEDPERWDPTRTRRAPLTFGVGRHHCLGSGLAQVELESLVRALTRRLDLLRVAAPLPALPVGRTFRSVPGLVLDLEPTARS